MQSTNHSPQEADNTVSFQRSHLYAALLPLAFVIGLSVGYLFWGRTTPEIAQSGVNPATVKEQDPTASPVDQSAAPVPTQENTPAEAESPAEDAQEIVRYDVPEDDDPVWGPDEAAITIIEFSDYQCPFCQRWHNETWPLLKEAYAGNIRLVFRDFPLNSIHPNAAPAAAAAHCAGEQQAYWEFSDLLFSNINNLTRSQFEIYAADLDLDQQAFAECLDSERYAEEVQADFDYAANLGVRSTPTFFVNGIPIVGAQPFEVFQNVIDKELAGEIP